MVESAFSSIPLPEFALLKKVEGKRYPLSMSLEITARCNNDCRHCYINLPAGDGTAKGEEMSLEEVKRIVDEAFSLGVVWCLITGGEPLLRKDFSEIYLYLKRKGFLISVFTNATLIAEEHIELFRKYPPRDLEVSVYGVTKETYGRVTRRPDFFDAFMRGLNLLLENGVRVRFKAMALRSNVAELQEISRFCRERTKDYFRFDPLLHLRFDRNPIRNEEIKSERLSAQEIVALERSDPERFQAMQESCDELIFSGTPSAGDNYLFRCNPGKSHFNIGYNGLFRICSSFLHPDYIYDLKKGTLSDAWFNFVPQVRNLRSDRKEFRENCLICPVSNLCLWCPAHAYLETGEMDSRVDYFCEVAHARAEALTKT